MAVDVALLQDVPVLADLDDAHRAELANWLDLDEVEAGRVLTRQGASGYAFYVVRSGELEVDHDGEVVGRLGPGDHLGEIALLGGGRRTATVRARTDATVLTLFGARFRELQSASPEVAAALEASMRQRLARDAGEPS